MIDGTRFKVSYKIDEDFKSDKFVKLRLKLCHDGLNPNKTYFKIEDLERKKDTLANSPMLAHIFKDENGKPTLGEHDMTIEQDAFNEGDYRFIYLEKPVGLIPEKNNFEIKEEDGKKYVYVDGYIWKDYSNYCLDILENYDEIKISMEVDILSYSYDKKNDYYEINDFIYKGVTFLNEKFETGMKNARAQIETFSKNEDSMSELKTIMQELSLALTQYNSTTKGEEAKMNTERVEEILKEYKITKESLNFEITDDMSEEDFKAKLEKMSVDENDKSIEESIDEENTNDKANETETTSEEDSEKPNNDYVSKSDIAPEKLAFTLASEKVEKLAKLVSDEFSRDESGSCVATAFYYIMDYDEKYAYYTKYAWNINDGDSKSYVRLAYVESNNNISANGQIEEVFQMYLTSAERDELNNLRTNYSALSSEVSELKEYKANIEKKEREEAVGEVFSMFDSELDNIDEYVALKENNEDMSIEDIKTKCFALIGMKKFSANKPTSKDKKFIHFSLNDNTADSDGEYDDLFKKYNSKEKR